VPNRWIRFDGLIAGAAFDRGDRIVVGCWRSSPFGPFADAMWAQPDGTRVLVAPTGDVLAFVSSQYRFEEHMAASTGARIGGDGLRFSGGPLAFEMELEPPGVASALLGLRPRRLRTWLPWISFEDAVLRPLVGPLLGGAAGIRTRGVTPGGVAERYAIHDLRMARRVRASVDGVDLGTVIAPREPARFGFSEFPARAGAVRVTSLFDASGVADPGG
jgi:hypothetical protein